MQGLGSLAAHNSFRFRGNSPCWDTEPSAHPEVQGSCGCRVGDVVYSVSCFWEVPSHKTNICAARTLRGPHSGPPSIPLQCDEEAGRALGRDLPKFQFRMTSGLVML